MNITINITAGEANDGTGDIELPGPGDGNPEVGEANELTLDDIEPPVGSVTIVDDYRGRWLAFRTKDGWISHDRWVTEDYHNWFGPQSQVYLVIQPELETAE